MILVYDIKLELLLIKITIINVINQECIFQTSNMNSIKEVDGYLKYYSNFFKTY